MEKTKESVIAKLEQLISKEPSKWLEKAKWRKENAEWLERSSLIALKVLRNLRSTGKTQIWLAEELKVSPQQVSKIVQGSENLTLETISKLERVLGIMLLEVPGLYGNVVPAAEQCANCPANYERTQFLASEKFVSDQPETVVTQCAESEEYKHAA